LQSYTLIATGWHDSADTSNLTYAWSYTVGSSNSAATATPLTSTAAAEYSTFRAALPPGKVTLQCSICDSSSVCTAAQATITVPALSSAQTADLPAAVRAAAAAASATAAAAASNSSGSSNSTATEPAETAAAAAVTLQGMVGYAAALTTAAHKNRKNSSGDHSSYASLVAAGASLYHISPTLLFV
jgi:trimeric autotransporter adhesin